MIDAVEHALLNPEPWEENNYYRKRREWMDEVLPLGPLVQPHELAKLKVIEQKWLAQQTKMMQDADTAEQKRIQRKMRYRKELEEARLKEQRRMQLRNE